MPDPSPVGEVLIRGVLCLRCEDGTRSAAEGRDLASVCRSLADDRLRFWVGQFDRGVTPHDRDVVLAEMERRGLKPAGPKPRRPARTPEPDDEPGQMVMWEA